MYKVIVSFADLQDNRYTYKAGDTFPRKGVTVSDERLQELLTARNRRGKPLIEEFPAETKKTAESAPEPPQEAAETKPQEPEEVKPKRRTKKKDADLSVRLPQELV